MSARRTKAASPCGVVGVVALDDRGDGLGQAPAAGEDAADQRVVDAELTALAVDALLGGAGAAVHLAGVARVGVHEHELADVVQQRGDHQAVAVLVAGLGGQAVGGALRGDAVQAEALGRGVPDGVRSKKSKVRARVASACTASGESSSTAWTIDSTLPRVLPSTWLASRSTAMTSATSDSTAATTSPARDALLALTRRSRRLRDSASAGKASSASKAAVRRRPWPSLWRRCVPAVPGRWSGGGCGQASAHLWGLFVGHGRSGRPVCATLAVSGVDGSIERASGYRQDCDG